MGPGLASSLFSIGDAFQSTHPVWDGTYMTWCLRCVVVISIHPSRVGWDLIAAIVILLFNISIHPSRVGWDEYGFTVFVTAPAFQSTHPVWDGTASDRGDAQKPWISIHPSRVGWDSKASARSFIRAISIHPSRVGWDVTKGKLMYQKQNISIHPSRVGWDTA